MHRFIWPDLIVSDQQHTWLLQTNWEGMSPLFVSLTSLLSFNKHTFHVKLAAVQGHMRTLHLCTHLNVSTEKEEHCISKLHSTSDTHSNIHTVTHTHIHTHTIYIYIYKCMFTLLLIPQSPNGWGSQVGRAYFIHPLHVMAGQ